MPPKVKGNQKDFFGRIVTLEAICPSPGESAGNPDTGDRLCEISMISGAEPPSPGTDGVPLLGVDQLYSVGFVRPKDGVEIRGSPGCRRSERHVFSPICLGTRGPGSFSGRDREGVFFLEENG